MHHYFEAITNTSGDSLVGYFARVIDPATSNTITMSADDNGTPIVTKSGVDNMGSTDDYGNLDFYVVPGTYHLDIYAPNATSFIFRVPNVAMNSSKGDPGPQGESGVDGATGADANSYASLSDMKAAGLTGLTYNLAAPSGADGGYANGPFTYQTGNFTGRTDVVKLDGTPLSTGALVRQLSDSVLYRIAAADAVYRTVQDRLSDGMVNVLDFGADPTGVTDSIAALRSAHTYALSVKRPLYAPAGVYLISDTFITDVGLVGDGSGTAGDIVASTKFLATTAAAFSGGKKMISGGSSNPGTYANAIPIRDFQIQGRGSKPSARSGNQSTQGFEGDGLFLGEFANNICVERVRVSNCRRGFDFGNRYGHLSLSECCTDQCWFGIYVSRNNSDYLALNCVIGSIFASIGGNTNNGNGTGDDGSGYPSSGISAFTAVRSQFGYAPYAVYIEYIPNPGEGVIALPMLANFMMFHSSMEACGNAAISTPLDKQFTSTNIEMIDTYHSWAGSGPGVVERPDLKILGDSNHPVQQHAMRVAFLSSFYSQGRRMAVGASGYRCIAQNLLGFVRDDWGTGGWMVNSGRQYLQYVGQGDYKRSVAVAADLPANNGTIATFTIPAQWTGAVACYIEPDLGWLTAASAYDAFFSVLVGGAAAQEFGPLRRLAANSRGTIGGTFRVALPGNNGNAALTVAVQLISVDNGLTLNPGGKPGRIVLTICQGEGIDQ